MPFRFSKRVGILTSFAGLALALADGCDAASDDDRFVAYCELHTGVGGAFETDGSAGAGGAIQRLVTPSECEEGHRCEPSERIATEGIGICSDECFDAYCPEGFECRDGDCYEVIECGRTVPCRRGATCDVLKDRCYQENGDCDGPADCPTFRGEAASLASVECASGTCQVRSEAPEIPWISRTKQTLTTDVDVRSSGLEFSWDARERGMLVRVLSVFPLKKSDWSESAVWKATIAPGSAHQVRFSDGLVRTEQGWVEPSEATLPPGRYYFVAVTLSESGAILESSAPRELMVGDGGDSGSPQVCASSSDCYDPLHPQLCVAASCRLICASHADCVGHGICRGLEEGARTCSK